MAKDERTLFQILEKMRHKGIIGGFATDEIVENKLLEGENSLTITQRWSQGMTAKWPYYEVAADFDGHFISIIYTIPQQHGVVSQVDLGLSYSPVAFITRGDQKCQQQAENLLRLELAAYERGTEEDKD